MGMLHIEDPFIAINSRIGVPVRVPFMGEKMCNHLLYLNTFNSMQMNDWYLIKLLLLGNKTWNFLIVCNHK